MKLWSEIVFDSKFHRANRPKIPQSLSFINWRKHLWNGHLIGILLALHLFYVFISSCRHVLMSPCPHVHLSRNSLCAVTQSVRIVARLGWFSSWMKLILIKSSGVSVFKKCCYHFINFFEILACISYP